MKNRVSVAEDRSAVPKRYYFNVLLLFAAILIPTLFLSSVAHGDSKDPRRLPLDLPSGGLGSKDGEEDPPEVIVFYGHEFEGNAFFWCFSAYAW